MQTNKRTGIIGIIITVAILLSLVIVTNMEMSGAENVFSRIVMPIQNGLTSLRNSLARKQCVF